MERLYWLLDKAVISPMQWFVSTLSENQSCIKIHKDSGQLD